MIQKQFAEKVTGIIKKDDSILGLAVAGSWLTNEIDEYSDLDLILVTKEKIGGDKSRMLGYAEQFGKLLAGFTGEHVGEPRVLICLYDQPLLHVDIKFLTLDEFHSRIETPFILSDTDGQLEQAIRTTQANFPYPDYQWIEDRFWTWIHYALTKIGRGEYFEAHDSLAFLRMVVFGPLFHIKNGNLPRAVRKAEMQFSPGDLERLKSTLADYNRQSLMNAVENSVAIYRDLTKELYTGISLKTDAEQRVIEFFSEIKE